MAVFRRTECTVIAVIKNQRYFCHAERFSFFRTGEDDVGGFFTTQVFRVLLTHHPADGVDDVTFSGTIGADDTGDAGVEVDHYLIRKGLEPGNYDLFQEHVVCLL